MNGALATRLLGWLTLAVFAGMSVVSHIWIRPDAPFMPQSAFFPYTDGALVAFRAFLDETGRTGLYRFLLVWWDRVFLVLFAVWVWRCHSALPSLRWNRGGQGLAILTLLSDLTEGVMLVSRLGLNGTASPLSPPFTGTSDVYPVTAIKICLYVACLISVYAGTRRARESRT